MNSRVIYRSQCTIFRPWQGWTAISSTGPGQGTLQVLPSLGLATAYIILRPFFRLRSEHLGRGADIALDADAWRLDLNSSDFPGSTPANGQAVLPETHPHLRVEKTVVSIPRVEPGDQVYWHTDIVHAVESEHNGPGDSSVLYIPAVPLTEKRSVRTPSVRMSWRRRTDSITVPLSCVISGQHSLRVFLRRTYYEVIYEV